MALPTRPVFATYVNADGTPKHGYVEFTMSKDINVDGIGVVHMDTIRADLDETGRIHAVLIANQDPAILANNMLWLVDEKIENGNVWYLSIPVGTEPIDIGDLYVPGLEPPNYGILGPPGPGVPAGGLTGQMLVKLTDISYDTTWTSDTPDGLPPGGFTGQILVKGPNGDYDANWVSSVDFAIGGNEVIVSTTEPDDPYNEFWLDPDADEVQMLDDAFVSKLGDRMTGPLVLEGNTVEHGAIIRFTAADVHRWDFLMQSDADRDLTIASYSDWGEVAVPVVIRMQRNGVVTIPGLTFSETIPPSYKTNWGSLGAGYANNITKHAGMITVQFNVTPLPDVMTSASTYAVINLPPGWRPTAQVTGTAAFIAAGAYNPAFCSISPTTGDLTIFNPIYPVAITKGNWVGGSITFRQGN